MSLSKESAKAVVSHMNEDHQDAVLEYALAFGKIENGTSARMLLMTSHYMDIAVQSSTQLTIRVHFDSPVATREDSRIRLVALLKSIRSNTAPVLEVETL